MNRDHRGEISEIVGRVYRISCQCGYEVLLEGAPFEARDVLFKHMNIYQNEKLVDAALESNLKEQAKEQRKRKRKYKRFVKRQKEAFKDGLKNYEVISGSENYTVYRRKKC